MTQIPKALIERQFDCRGEVLVAKVFLLNHCLLCVAYRDEEPVEYLEPREHLLPAYACQQPGVAPIAERYLDVVLAFWSKRACA